MKKKNKDLKRIKRKNRERIQKKIRRGRKEKIIINLAIKIGIIKEGRR